MPKIQKPKRRIRIIHSTYSNHTDIHWSEYDFLLSFNQFPPDDTGMVPSTRISISPSHAKYLVGGLTHTIKCYEKKYGKIKQIEPITEREMMDERDGVEVA